MIIAQISDTHIALDTPDSDRRIEDFERTIADINALDPLPDIVIHTGDIVHNGRADEYRTAAKILARANPPTYIMVGNKDDRNNLRAEFSTAEYPCSNPDFVSYAIEGFPVRLIMLDTLKPGSNKGTFCEARLSGFAKMVEADSSKPIAVFAHHPPFMVPEGPEPLHFETEEVMQTLRQALLQSKRIVAIYCGHVHRGVPGAVGDIPVMVMPSVATGLRKGDYPHPIAGRPVYHIHRFDPACGFSTEARIVDTA